MGISSLISKTSITGTDGNPYEVTSEMVTIERKKEVINVIEYTPNVIEPSFGIGRILYCLLEHSYYVRQGDEQRAVFSFPACVSPTKVLVVPLSNNQEFKPLIKEVVAKLRKAGIPNKVDDSSGSIGRRYARNDELGTSFGITIDFDTVKDHSVTLRERDTTKQIRGPLDQVIKWCQELIDGNITWESLIKEQGEFVSETQ